MRVYRDDFDIISPRIVKHRRSGCEFSSNGDEDIWSLRIDAESIGNVRDRDAIAAVALHLLREMAVHPDRYRSGEWLGA